MHSSRKPPRTQPPQAEALHESEARFRAIIETSRDLVAEFAAGGELTYMSPNCPDALGYSAAELLAMTPFSLTHPEDRERVEGSALHSIECGAPIRLAPYRVRRGNGSWLWLETTGFTYRRADGEIRLVTVGCDITARRREEERQHELEERMQRAQKLESLGVMAGGVAHDFNNLLTPILGEASLGLVELPHDSPVRARLIKIQHAAQRAAGLTNQMLSYAGRSPVQVERLDVSALVQEMRQLVESAGSPDTALTLELSRELPAVEADAAQLGQLVINLISNASESLGEGAGRIAIRTGVTEVHDPGSTGAVFSDTLDAGTHVYFEVEDNGSGISPEVQAKIFDPFFTTKFTGRGLGLAAVAGIVRGHRGAIEIDSEVGRGTRFRVLLPAAAGPVAEVTEAQPPCSWRGSGTVLVVDDDEAVLDLTSELLRRVGLDVIAAGDGATALEAFRRRAGEIDLVLLDRAMPCTGGRQVFEEILRIRPDAAVVVMSGFSQARATARLPKERLAGFLKKPFLPETLTERVREVLETRRAR